MSQIYYTLSLKSIVIFQKSFIIKSIKHVANNDFAIYRQGELYWHDLRFLIDCVADTAPDEQIIGYMSAPWYRTIKENEPYFDETFALFSEAIEKFYN